MPKTATPPAIDTPKPTMASVAPDWVARSAKSAELHARRNVIAGELAALNKRYSLYPNSLNETPVKQRPTKKLSDAARRLLGTTTPEQPEPQPTEQQWSNFDARRAQELNAEYWATGEAIAELNPHLERSQFEGSKKLCTALRDDYAPVARRLIAAVIELGKA